MKLVSQLLKYVILLLAIVFIVGVITFVAMFISYKSNPEKPIKIFGYSFYASNINEEKVINSYVSSIEVSSKFANIEIEATNETAIHVKVYNKMIGVAKLEPDMDYKYSTKIEDNTLKISTNEPKGLFVNTSSASVKVSVPTSLTSNIIVNAERGSVIVGNKNDSNYKFNVKNITINAKNKNVNVLTFKNDVQNLTINTNNNYTTIQSKVKGTLNISTKLSTLKFKEVNNIEVNASNLKLVGETLNNNLNFKGASGILELNTVNGNVNIEGNIKTYIKTLNGSYTDSNRTSSSLTLENVKGAVTAKSKSGTTTIKNCNTQTETVDITSTNGNIKVGNISSNLNITTNSGLCTIDFADIISNKDKTFNFTAKNGSLTANNINTKLNITIKDEGVCTLNLNYKQVNGENIINAQRGTVNIVAPIQKILLTIDTNASKDISYADLYLLEYF